MISFPHSLVDRLVPGTGHSVDALEVTFPPRQLEDGAQVTRFAPSPTGFMHIGGVYAALISQRLASQSNGVFFLRIEDTDKKRQVEGAIDLIVDALRTYNLSPNEGEVAVGHEVGLYGPYLQSERKDIYHTYVRELLLNQKAYPCFASPEELKSIAESQEKAKIRPGYYGEWAMWRDRPVEDILKALDEEKPFVIRFRSTGDIEKRHTIPDLVRGDLEIPESDQDIVIMKADGLPTYHFAHVVDDHLMRTTIVVRGDEWLSSAPVHIQLFEALGWAAPSFAHIAPIQKMDGTSRRKLSKRKDPEASVTFYDENGYLPQTVEEYLLNLANSRFEVWRAENPTAELQVYKLEIDNLSVSGALFDLVKLDNIGKTQISFLSAVQLYELGVEWSQQHDTVLWEQMTSAKEYTELALNIERTTGNVRKDIAKLSDLRAELYYFYDALYDVSVESAVAQLLPTLSDAARTATLDFLSGYQTTDDKDTWMEKMRSCASSHGYARTLKEYKKSPDTYSGHVGDLARVIRILITGRERSPDLWEIMQVMGAERVEKRLRCVSEENPLSAAS